MYWLPQSFWVAAESSDSRRTALLCTGVPQSLTTSCLWLLCSSVVSFAVLVLKYSLRILNYSISQTCYSKLSFIHLGYLYKKFREFFFFKWSHVHVSMACILITNADLINIIVCMCLMGVCTMAHVWREGDSFMESVFFHLYISFAAWTQVVRFALQAILPIGPFHQPPNWFWCLKKECGCLS